MFLAAALILSCTVTDGDTIRCGDERIRLTGIDAPEMSTCPRRRRCAPGDGPTSKRNLRAILQSGEMSIVRLGQDRYGRTLAAVYVDGRNVACAQIAAGQAIYRADWDDGGLVARDCGF